jgi:hypothetical protein
MTQDNTPISTEESDRKHSRRGIDFFAIFIFIIICICFVIVTGSILYFFYYVDTHPIVVY